MAGFYWIVYVIMSRHSWITARSIVAYIPRLIDRHYWLFRTLYRRLQLTRNNLLARSLKRVSLDITYIPAIRYSITPVCRTMAKLKFKTCQVCVRCAYKIDFAHLSVSRICSSPRDKSFQQHFPIILHARLYLKPCRGKPLCFI